MNCSGLRFETDVSAWTQPNCISTLDDERDFKCLHVAVLKCCRGKCPSILQTASVSRNKLRYCAVTSIMSRVSDRCTLHVISVIGTVATHFNEETPCPFLMLQSLSLAQIGVRGQPCDPALGKQGGQPKVIWHQTRWYFWGESHTFPLFPLNFSLWKISKT